MHSATELVFRLTLEQSSLLLEALVEQPFKQVFEIIGALNAQAQQFYQSAAEKHRAQQFVLGAADFTVCIKALGELPYNRVSSLIEELHRQLHAQLLDAVESSSDELPTTRLEPSS